MEEQLGALEAENGIATITFAVISAVLKIGLLVAVGMKLELQGMLNGPKRKCLSALAMDVCLPCLLFSDVLPEAEGQLIAEGWQLLFLPPIYAAVGALIGVLCCLVAGTPTQHLGAAAACAAFPNVNGFPVSIISALGPALPKSPQGFSPMVFLALIQLTDGIVKYTVGPAVFRRDLRAVHASRAKRGVDRVDSGDDLPLGASLRSISMASSEHHEALDEATPPEKSFGRAITPGKEGCDVCQPPREAAVTAFGLTPEQVRFVHPDWSRFDSGKFVWSPCTCKVAPSGLEAPLLAPAPMSNGGGKAAAAAAVAERGSNGGVGGRLAGIGEMLRQLFPPQVTAVILALLLGLGPDWIKALLYDPALSKQGGQPLLGFVYGTAKSLGGGFVPLQMISLGGRLVNVVGDSGPFAATGEAGPRGRARLLRICVAVGVARMVLTPAALYGLAVVADAAFLQGSRPMAFWAPALIVVAMPTANNMSTMADIIGSGRSISAAGVAMQLLASPLVLAVSLSLLIAGAQYRLASDYIQ
eukprot:CAMPEP_0203925546 /NCGR_PEP_ID=MMETSP0359-20131031/65173_1 /ASSEMBLY_ACC=CAM_ASM_000338 /TAXON_ID=268821 /ORGANISM="Scrippsiella Hangoei, Strain SHTV-5" /LENGTH=528 /DNA_ID=CAMNT_0050853985 /DNA_START=63 /DNA_END=1649 /DNA_ORIENTATION=+